MKNVKMISAAVVVMALCAVVHAGDACEPGKLKVYANFETISVYVDYQGDDNGNAVAIPMFKGEGGDKWRMGHPLSRIKGNRFAGSIFGLKSGTEYGVRVTITDPDNPKPKELSAGFDFTRTDKFKTGTGKTHYVSTTGSDEAAGSKASPFKTIQHAMKQVSPGDVVIVTPGVYHETVTIQKNGRWGAYITLRGQPGARIVGLPKPDAPKPAWTRVEGDLYKTNPGYRTRYVAIDGKRVYYWKTLDLLKLGSEERRGKTYSVKGGWTQEKDGTLYMRLTDGGDPNNVNNIQITRHRQGIVLAGVQHVIIEGLDIGFFGDYPVVLRQSSRCVIRNNVIHNSRNGIIITHQMSSENLVEGNELFDTSVWDWPWQLCKAHDPEGSAIVLQGGRGNVIRRNRIHGYFNAIVPSMWGRLDDERFNGDMDVHDNEMWDIGDDCLEPEGTCINQRYWKNTMRGALMGISLAPITVGPAYFIRNTVFDHHLSSVKLASNSSGPCFLYHNTFVTTVTNTDKYSTRKVVNGIGNSGGYHNMTYRNNIIQGTDQAYCDWRRKTPRDFSMDYDNLYTTHPTHFFMFGAKRYSTMAEMQKALPFEKHGLNVDARFVDLKAGDLRLKADSPLIDKGIRIPNINDDFKGNAPDIGAFEKR